MMSSWRLILKELYSAGPGTIPALDVRMGGFAGVSQGLWQAQKLGLAENTRTRGGNKAFGVWHLTQLGTDWCEGRVHVAPAKRAPHIKTGRPPMRLAATWLMSLPRGIAINSRASAAEVKQ